MVSEAVRKAKRAKVKGVLEKLKDRFPVASDGSSLMLQAGGTTFIVEVNSPASLSARVRKEVIDLLEDNMKELYEQSPDGYDKRAKEAELFDPNGRVLLVRLEPEPEHEPSEEQELVAYLIWRFMEEETADEVALVDTAYCWELQVHPTKQKTGLGRALMNMLVIIAKDWSMTKVMLTCFTNNKGAIAFYERQGFAYDEISPCFYRYKEEEEEAAGYEILSLVVV